MIDQARQDKQGSRTDEIRRQSIAQRMQDTDQPTRVPDRLLIPNYRLPFTLSLVFRLIFIFAHARCFVGGADGEDEEERGCGAGHEGQHVRVGDAVNIVEGEGGGKTELVH